jgi:O-antigen/teichoic acid export membrane protein
LISSFGLLGFEQVFLRMSNNTTKNELSVDKKLLIIIAVVWMSFGILSAYLLKSNFLSDIAVSFWMIYICTLGVSGSMFLFNVFRVNSNFFTAQILVNHWKVILFGISIVYFLYGKNQVELILLILTIFFFIFFIYGTIISLRKIKFNLLNQKNIKKIFFFALQFSISLFTLSLIGYGDKFFIEKKFGLEELGDYFFLANIFVFPFSILQSYVGFKELVSFKKEFSKTVLKRKSRQISLFGLALSIFLIIMTFIASELEIIDVDINNNKILICLFLFLGVIKLNYSLLSSVFGAVGLVKSITQANLQFLTVFVIVFFLFKERITEIHHIVLIILLFWLLRVIIWWYNIFKQTNESQI